MIDILNLPFFYNLRQIVAGNQQLTRNFIINNYNKYNCNSVLDVGCGTGDFASLFSVKEYLGIDYNSQYIAYAKNKYPHRFICDDVLIHRFQNLSFDASLLISTLHHFSDDEIKKIFTQITLLTNKIIIIVDLNPDTSPIKKLLISLDRGKYVRTIQQKVNLLSHFGKIVNIKNFSTRLASQTGMVLLLNHEKK